MTINKSHFQYNSDNSGFPPFLVNVSSVIEMKQKGCVIINSLVVINTIEGKYILYSLGCLISFDMKRPNRS